MLKFACLVILISIVREGSSQTICDYVTCVNWDYTCPSGYIPFDFAWFSRFHWTITKWASVDHPFCAIKNTYHPCFKPNGAPKDWMTFFSGYATYKIEKYDYFSFSSYGSDYISDATRSSLPMSQLVSDTLVPWYFSVRTLTFYVRGAQNITIIFDGPIYREIFLSDDILDPRQVTFIAIDWPENPVTYTIEFIFNFPPKNKIKFWGLYMIACCELLSTTFNVGK